MAQTKINNKQLQADGWTLATDSWTYASATTITVDSGAAAIYSIGDKFKLTANSVVLQGYIITIADTLLTVVGDALTNHVFSATYYSKAATPLGFPHWFAYTPTGISATNVTLTGRFCLINRSCQVQFLATFTGGITFTTMPTLPIPASASRILNVYNPCGEAGYIDAGTIDKPNGLRPFINPSGTVLNIAIWGGVSTINATYPITWANNDKIEAYVVYDI